MNAPLLNRSLTFLTSFAPARPRTRSYAQEALRLLRDVGLATTQLLLAPDAASDASPVSLSGKALVSAVGLKPASFKAIQTAVKRFGEDGGDLLVLETGDALVTALSEVFEVYSGAGFVRALQRAVNGENT